MPKWCVFVRPGTCVCEMYVHRIIMSACVWVLLLGAFTLLSVYCSCCHRMALPAELYQQDVGEVENYFFLLWCRCSLNLFTGFREEKKKKSNLAAIHCVNVYLHACVCFSLHRQGQQMSFITVKMPNKLSTPPCLLWRHLRSRTHARACSRRAELLRPAAPAVVTPWIFYYRKMEERDIWTKCIICCQRHPGSCVFLKSALCLRVCRVRRRFQHFFAVNSRLSSGINVDFHLCDTQPAHSAVLTGAPLRKPAAAEWVGFQNILSGSL